MHEVFKIKSSKTNPKFQQNFINFEKPQNFQKPQILGFKTWNACKWKRLEAHQVKENLKKTWESQGKRFGVSERGLGMKSLKYWERDQQKWAGDCTRCI